MSLAIDREAIAEAVVFAKAATGLVPYGVYDSNSDKDLFREVGGDILATKADFTAAEALIAESGLNPDKFMFSISVAAYDDVHMAIAELVKEAWILPDSTRSSAAPPMATYNAFRASTFPIRHLHQPLRIL